MAATDERLTWGDYMAVAVEVGDESVSAPVGGFYVARAFRVIAQGVT